jgi:hypothetical protein
MACQGLDVHRLREVTMKGGNEVTIRGQRKNCKYAFPTAELPERIGALGQARTRIGFVGMQFIGE